MNTTLVNLKLFDGEAPAAPAETQASEPQGDQIKYESTHHTQKGDQVAYGKQPEPVQNTPEQSEVKTTSNTLEDRKKAYQDLINGEYKDLYTEDTQRIINKRFKDTKVLEAKINESEPIIEMLKEKYKVTEIGDLTKALENDTQYWEEIAEESGMTVEQYKEFQRLKKENEKLRQIDEQQKQQQMANTQLEQWTKEADQLTKKFPNFNLEAEVGNEAFIKLLQAGTPMEHAYKVMHFDELMAQEKGVTEKAVIENIRAKGMRPQENGTASQSAFTVKDDVSKLTKEDRAEIARRVARGEKIVF